MGIKILNISEYINAFMNLYMGLVQIGIGGYMLIGTLIGLKNTTHCFFFF